MATWPGHRQVPRPPRFAASPAPPGRMTWLTRAANLHAERGEHDAAVRLLLEAWETTGRWLGANHLRTRNAFWRLKEARLAAKGVAPVKKGAAKPKQAEQARQL